MSEPTANFDAAIQAQARDWVLRLASGDMDPDELDRFKAWLAQSDRHAQAFEQRRALWLELGSRPELFERPPAAPPRHRTAARGAVAAAATAAVLLAVLAAPGLMLRLEADHSTATAAAAYSLPDGSTAWLDADSAIGVDFDDAERRVTLLRGTAFFTVRHAANRPFRVTARDGEIEDIGTSFEVKLVPGRVEVTVAEGAVRVLPGKGTEPGVELRAGDGASYDGAGALRQHPAAAPSGVAAWRRGELMLERQPLDAAIRAIARYRSGPTWIWADLSDRAPVNGAFRTGDADAALLDLAAAQGLSVLWLPGGIAVVRPGPA